MKKLRWLLGGALGLALVAGGVGAGVASSDDDVDEAVIGTDAERASAAALAYTERGYAAGGQVIEVEKGDDGAAFGVEVVLPDGRQIEVHLDADFAVTGDEADDE